MRGPRSARTVKLRSGWLVLLYGTLEFDGRVQRMVDVLRGIGGQVVVVDVKSARDVTPPEDDTVTRVRVSRPAGRRRILGHALMLIHGLRAAKVYRPAVVVAEDYYTAWTALLLARVAGARLVYDAHELIIPEPESKMSTRGRFWYLLERLAVNASDLIIAANDERARIMAQHYNLVQVPVTMRNIPPLQHQADAKGEPVSARSAPLRRSDREVLILYQGSISLPRGLGSVIDALGYLPEYYRLVLIGDGPDMGAVVKMTADLMSTGRVKVLGRIPHDQLRAVSGLADVGIVVYPYEGLNNIHCAPNKLFEYAQAGLPVVTTCQPILRETVKEYDIGVCVERNGGAKGFARGIEVVAERGKSGYHQQIRKFLTDHTWESEAERVRRALHDALGLQKDECA